MAHLKQEAEQTLTAIQRSMEDRNLAAIELLLKQHAAIWREIYTLEYPLLLA